MNQFECRLDTVEFGPFTMADIHYNRKVAVEVPEIDCYQFTMGLQMSLVSTNQGREVDSPPGTATLYRIGSGTTLRTSSDVNFSVFGMKIAPRALENTLSALIGRTPDRERIRFDTQLDITRGDGLRWWKLLRAIREQRTDNPLLANPMVAAPLFQSILSGLLLAAHHQYSERLREAEPKKATPPTMRMAEDYILDRIADPITVMDVAASVGISIRALQRGFVQHFGMTPSQYIRTRRLTCAHAELVASDPAQTRVIDVATRWGFSHLGRFAGEYRAAYGVTPRQTLQA